MGKKDDSKSVVNSRLKYLKLILFVLLLVTIFAGVMYGTVKVLEFINRDETAEACTYVAKMEEGQYYITKASNKIKFRVATENLSDYTIKDSNGTEVQTQILNEKDEHYLSANEPYNEGQIYYLTLNTDDAVLMDKNLSDARSVIFKIDKKEEVNYDFKDNVKLEKSLGSISENNGVKTLDISGKNYNVNDVIVLEQGGKQTQAYKVASIENNIATLTTPELTDIYDDLEIYKDLQVNFNNLEINDEFKDQILQAYEKTEWYQYLENEVYAAIEPSIKITPSGNKIKIEAEFKIKKNDSNTAIGIQALKNHDITIKFTTNLSCQVLPDMKLNDHMDFTATLTQEFNTKIEIKKGKKIFEGIDELKSEDYDKSLTRLWDMLEGNPTDTASSRARLYAVELPTGLSCLNVYVDFYVQTKLVANVNASFEEGVKLVETVGISSNSSGTKPYANIDCAFTDTLISAEGKAELKLGLGADIGASFISKDIAQVGMGVEGGFYATALVAGEVSINGNSSSLKDATNGDVVGKIEIGAYFEPKINASINFGFTKLQYSETLKETKKPFKTWGNSKATIGIEPEKQNIIITDGNFTLPTIYKKVKDFDGGGTSKEAINPGYVTVKDKDGNSILGPMKLDSNNQATLIVEYQENNKTFQTTIYVTVKANNTNNGVNINRGNSGSQTSTETNSQSTTKTKKRITEEEARKLAEKVGGTEDDESGYPMGYSLEAMVKDSTGLEYYLFRMRWLVENSHWSTVGGIVIASDGSKWKYVDIYDNYKDGDTIKTVGKEGTF